MQYISSYFVFLFTVQLVLILRQASSLWLLALWGFLFFGILVFRKDMMFPQDHPHAPIRQRLILLSLAFLLLLPVSHLYFYNYVQQYEDSVITAQLTRETNQGTVQLSGRVVSMVERDGDRIRFDLQVNRLNQEKLPSNETVKLSRYVLDLDEKQSYEPLAKGDYWEGFVELSIPNGARNPGAFDYKNYLFQQHIHYVGNIVDTGWSYAHDSSWKGKIIYFLDRQRTLWIDQVEHIFSDEAAPIVQAMTIGYRSEIDPQLTEMYQELGIIHVLAISGLHVGIILWSLYWGLTKLPLTREKVLVILFLFIPFYIYVSGAQVSVVRAGLMGMIVIVCLRYNLWKHSLLGLYAVYVATLFFNPYFLYNVGYQLSFLVTYVLMVAYPAVRPLLHQWRLPEWFKTIVGISLLAQLASLPILLFYFYQFSPLSLVINIIIVPIYSIIFIPVSFMITIISFLNVDVLQLAIFLYEYGLHLLHKALHWVYSYSFSTIHMGKPQGWWFFLYFSLFITWLIQLELKKWKASWVVMFLLVFLIPLQLLLPYLDNEAKIMVLDVGQGEAIVVELPYRAEVLIIDLGGQISFQQEEWRKRSKEFEVGRDIILPYLRYRGINKVDKIIVTHGHFDHFSGIQGILGQVKIGQFLRSPITAQSDFERTWLHQLNQYGVPLYSLGRGDKWGDEHAYFHVLFPKKDDDRIESVRNLHDYNVVLWNKIYQTTFLWTGDIEDTGEKEILVHYPQLKADFLKIAHHGSSTSTSEEWLEKTEPKVALISVGSKNRYGHPDEDVIQRLKEDQIKIYRTDVHGGIMIKVSPDKVLIVPTLQESRQAIK
jgi:competence protein ComEC